VTPTNPFDPTRHCLCQPTPAQQEKQGKRESSQESKGKKKEKKEKKRKKELICTGFFHLPQRIA